MKQQATFTGWDFSTIWSINENVDYPHLLSESLTGECIGYCGDGIVSGTEQCEENTDCPNGQYCDACQCIEPVCGNGKLELGEMCEVNADCGAGQQCTNCECVVPTLISLSSFEAAATNKKIILTWTTESEIDNAGFNIYRAESENGQYVKINTSLIPAKGAVTQGASYEIIDKDVKNRKTYYYKLEDIDLNGTSNMHGPVSAMPKLIYRLKK